MAVVLNTGARTSTITFCCREGTLSCPHKELCANLRNRELTSMLRYMALSQMLGKATCRITIVETKPDGTTRQIHPRLRFNNAVNASHPMLKETQNGS